MICDVIYLMLMFPKPKRKKSKKNKISATEKKRVYDEVLERASINGYPQCENCGHNGTRYSLEMSHLGGHDLPASRDLRTTPETVRLLCSKCHSEIDHGNSKPILRG